MSAKAKADMEAQRALMDKAFASASDEMKKVGVGWTAEEKLAGLEQVRYNLTGDPAPASSIRLTTMNVRVTKDNWADRKQPLTDLLKKANADVYHFQESDWSQHHLWEQELAGNSSAKPIRKPMLPCCCGEDKSLKRVDDLQTVLKPRGSSSPKGDGKENPDLTKYRYTKAQGEYAYRGAILQVVNHSNKRILFVNTHLDYRFAQLSTRDTQVKNIMAEVDNIPCDAVVISGDFNGPATENWYKALTDAGYKSAMMEKYGKEFPSYKLGNLETGASEHTDEVWYAGAAVWSSKEFGKHTDKNLLLTDAIDFIMYKGCLELEDVGQIGTQEIKSGLFPSDHAGFVATFKVQSEDAKNATSHAQITSECNV